VDANKRFSTFFEKKFVEYQSSLGRRISINEFADYVGYSQPTISKWLAGNQVPSGEAVDRLAVLFGMEVYDALDIPRPDPRLALLMQRFRSTPEENKNELLELVANYLRELGLPVQQIGYSEKPGSPPPPQK
jgi:transcriptional regulator with XRE-family HTH domain